MKVGILTLPLHNNYGGILQAYALSTTLKRMGHDVWIVNFYPNSKIPTWKFPLVLLKRVASKYLLRKDEIIFKEKAIRAENQKIQGFIDQYVQPQTRKLYTTDDLNNLSKEGFGAFIVGSDQVWRERYNRPFASSYFLEFGDSKAVKKLSYAASFGVDKWEYDEATTNTLKSLAKGFTAISVREDSGVRLCKESLSVSAEHHLDPTMLLSPSDYNRVTKRELNSNSELLVYVLDDTEDKKNIVKKIADTLNYHPFSIGHGADNAQHSSGENVHPSIESWLEGFSKAKFTVTDSFHGCVFSILFNKPFLVVGNDERGLARFTSLLKLFNLEDRLVRSLSEVTNEKMKSPIAWEEVNGILAKKRDEALSFLNKHLV